VDPLSAAEIAKMYGIRIYTIGIGTNGMAPYPVQTPFGIQLQPMQVEIDEADTALRALVSGLAESIPNGGELLKHVAAAQDTPAALANVIAASLVADAKIRQHLLETTNVFARLEILSNEVVALTERVGKPGRAN